MTWPRTDAHGLKQSDVERAVNPAVKVSAGGRDAALPLQRSKVVGGDAEPLRRFGYMTNGVFH
jgi:hypothetical protein